MRRETSRVSFLMCPFCVRALLTRWTTATPRRDVALRTDTRKRILHRNIGLITLDCQILVSQNQTENLVVFTATPGTEDEEARSRLGHRNAGLPSRSTARVSR
jgi:MmyB-like transcription regulator ligand binding domain